MNPKKKSTNFTICLIGALLLFCVAGLTTMASGQQPGGESTIYSFTQFESGYVPIDVIQGPDGNWYGATQVGGSSDCISGCGVIYKLVPSSTGWIEQVIHTFTAEGNDGLNPNGSLVFDAQGNLWGTAPYGGQFQQGVVFELTPTRNGEWTETIVHSFGGGPDDGIEPWGHLLLQNGKLIGTTQYGGGSYCDGYGCGTVFELSHNAGSAWTYNIIYNFNDAEGLLGGYPNPGLIPNNPAAHGLNLTAGALYGTASASFSPGYQSGGEVFQLVPPVSGNKWTVKVLYTFPWQGGSNEDGFWPVMGVIMDTHGNLFGTTINGGQSSPSCQQPFPWNCGTVYEVTPTSKPSQWTETVIHSFGGPPNDGLLPQSFLSFDSSGALYGVTPRGGNSQNCGYGCGTVFKMVKEGGSWTESVVVSFNASDGWWPDDQLNMGADGWFYGTAQSMQYGLVYKFKP